MPEPDNFTPQEQLQDTTRRVANRIIREYFKDVVRNEADLDLTTPRQALLKACLHREDDSLLATIARNQLFSQYTTFTRDQIPIVAGTLLDEIDANITYRPKITLYFKEDDDDVDPGYQPVRMEVSWRLVDETTQSITKAKLTAIANKIKTNFGTGTGYLFKKGRKIVAYTKRSQGYNFILRARDLASGKDLIREVLSMNGHTLDTENLKISEVDDELSAFPYNSGSQIVLGKRIPKPRKRPLVNVRFRYAYATIHGRRKPMYLYSKNWYIPDALIE